MKEENKQPSHNKALSFSDEPDSTVVSFYESLLKKEENEHANNDNESRTTKQSTRKKSGNYNFGSFISKPLHAIKNN